MPVPDPPWKVRTRPCPFYSQGRCLFADACNYLHDVKIKATPIITKQELAEAAEQSRGYAVEEGRDTGDRASRRSMSRPTSIERSPRMQSLLAALGDVLPPEDDPTCEDPEETLVLPKAEAASPPAEGARNHGEPDFAIDEDALRRFSHSAHNPSATEEIRTVQEDSIRAGREIIFAEEEDDNPIEEDSVHSEEDDTIRPGHGSSHSTPVKDPLTPVDAVAEEQPSLTATESHVSDLGFDMLSPVSMGGAPPTPFPLQLCDLERTDSVDSGYADSWTGPTPFVLSPPRSPRPTSTLSILSSPFGSPSAKLSGSRVSAEILLSPSKAMFAKDGPRASNEEDALTTPTYHDAGRRRDDDIDSLDSFELDDGPATRDAGCERSSPAFEYDLDSPVDDSFDCYHHPSANSTLSDVNTVPEVSGLGILDHYYEVSAEISTAPESEQAVQQESAPLVIRDLDAGSPLLSQILPEQEGPASPRLSPPQFTNPFDSAEGGSVASFGDESSYLGSTSFFSSFPLPPADVPTAAVQPIHPGRAWVPAAPSQPFSPPTSVRAFSPTASARAFSPPTSARAFSPQTSVRAFSPPTLLSPAIKVDHVPASGSPIRPRSSLAFVHRVEVDRPARGAASEAGSDHSEGHSRNTPSFELPSKKVPFGFRQKSSSAKRTSLVPVGNVDTRPSSPSLATTRTGERSVSPASSISRESFVEGSSKLRPLRLSRVLSPTSFEFSEAGPSSRPLSLQSSNDPSHTLASRPQSPSVSSEQSISDLQLLSSARSSLIPEDIRNMLAWNNQTSGPQHSNQTSNRNSFAPPRSAPINRPISWLKFSHTRPNSRASLYENSPARALSRLSEPAWGHTQDDAFDEEDNDDAYDPYDHTIRKPLSALPRTVPRSRPASMLLSPSPTPKPTLMFAIASDDVEEVRRVLESGEAEPNAQVGPQSALAFTLTNDRLKNKIGIVKELLAHGADPAALRNPDSNPPEALTQDQVSLLSPPPSTTLDGMDPATRYFISKADNPDTRRASALIHRSFFRPLAKVRYDIIGQDRALEQLFRVLSMNSQQFSVAPLVVLLCGPSGHGKSLLARKFGSLLEVPTHTVNMTTLRSTHDIWLSHSMNPYEEPSSSTLAEFLIDNEGKRCVVVLDEIDKTEDEKFLLSLLMPWEIGRCSPEAGRRHIDVRNVIWIGTANIGHDLVFAYEAERPDPYSMLSREEYVELMRQFRPVVSDRLGASLVSRMTTVLPFVPFTEDEKMAIAAEALYTLGKDLVQTLPSETVETMLRRAMDDYLPDEGARCLYRSVSTQLLDFSM